jgi:hypothetical protein
MWEKVAEGVYCFEDVDGMPLAVATTLDDGTPLKVAAHGGPPVAGCSAWTDLRAMLHLSARTLFRIIAVWWSEIRMGMCRPAALMR